MIILASSSPYRASLLKQIGIKAVCISPNIDETALKHENPQQLSVRLAQEKCQHVAQHSTEYHNKPCWIIAGDQTAECQHQLIGKPGTLDNARKQLNLMSNQSVIFYSSLYIMNTQTHRYFAHCEKTMVDFLPLSATTIERYLELEKPLNCAGSFKSEGLGISLFKRIKSDDPTALVGLPLISVCQGLKQLDYDVILECPHTE